MQGGDPYLPSAVAQDHGIREVFAREPRHAVEFVTEPMHTLESGTHPSDRLVTQYLGEKFKDRRPDIVIALRQPALDFLERTAGSFWSDIPVVFCGVPDDALFGRTLSSRTSGVMMSFDISGTIDLAQRLNPRADRIAIISGTSAYDRAWKRRVEGALSSRARPMPVTWISDAPLDGMLKRVAALPPNTVILYSSVFRDSSGTTFVPRDVIHLFADRARSPIYSFFDTYLGMGIIGGSISRWEEQGTLAGELALHKLQTPTERAQVIIPSPPALLTVDWRQLKRWDIDAETLPAGTRVLFRPEPLLARYRLEISIVMLLVIAQTVLIAALFLQRRRARRAEKAAAEQRSALDQASRLAVLGELTAGIAHEINQPLGAIMSNADAAQMMLEQQPPQTSEAAAVIVSIQRASARASDVVQKVRSLARGKPLELRPLHLNDVVREATELMMSNTTNAGVTSELRLANDLPRVAGDKSALQQILINVIFNAIDAMKGVPRPSRRLIISTSLAAPDEIALSVSDSGHGLTDEAQRHLFDSFFTTKPAGMGLGLTIVRSIVEAHGGRLSAFNNEDSGVTIRATLRIAGCDGTFVQRR
ncbi:sensor histidine kinase [Pararobbsia alpina]|nr:ATP-binding protein [Pararobbsia alpina]